MYLSGQVNQGSPLFSSVDFQTLVRKGLILEGAPTVYGISFYDELLANDSGAATVIKEQKAKTKDDFHRWYYETFPGTDGFTWKGKTFARTRSLRKGPEECKQIFTKIIAKGEFTAEQIIQATAMDVLTRKNASIEARENKLKYINNSATYLRQLCFEPYVELLSSSPTKDNEEPQRSDVVDI